MLQKKRRRAGDEAAGGVTESRNLEGLDTPNLAQKLATGQEIQAASRNWEQPMSYSHTETNSANNQNRLSNGLYSRASGMECSIARIFISTLWDCRQRISWATLCLDFWPTEDFFFQDYSGKVENLLSTFRKEQGKVLGLVWGRWRIQKTAPTA